MSVAAVPTLLGPILAPSLGGLLIATGSWRWVFLVNIPIGLAGTVAAASVLPDTRSSRPDALDWRGLVLAGPALVALVAGATRLGQAGEVGDPAGLAATGGGVVLAAVFVRHALAAGCSALVDLRVFRVSGFAAGAAGACLGRFTGDGMELLIPLYLQQVRGASALEAGLALAPQGIGAALALPVAGVLADRHGPRRVAVAGSTLALLATLPLLAAGAGTSYVLLCACLLVRGLGASLGGLPPVSAAYAALPPTHAATASTTLNIGQRVGSPLGAAALLLVLAAGTASGGTSPAGAYRHAFGLGIAGLLGLVAVSTRLPLRQRGRA